MSLMVQSYECIAIWHFLLNNATSHIFKVRWWGLVQVSRPAIAYTLKLVTNEIVQSIHRFNGFALLYDIPSRIIVSAEQHDLPIGRRSRSLLMRHGKYWAQQWTE